MTVERSRATVEEGEKGGKRVVVGRRKQVYANQGTVLRATSQSETKGRKVRGQVRQRAEASSLASGLSAKGDEGKRCGSAGGSLAD